MENLKNLIEKLEMLKNISSSNSKKVYINNNKDDKQLMFAIEFLLNKDKKTGISKLKEIKNGTIPKLCIDNLEDMVEYLLDNNTGRDIDIAELQYYLQDKEDIIKELLLKKLKLGITAKTMNKIIPNFIYHFEIMSLKNIENCKEKFFAKASMGGYSLEIKENGVHGVVMKNNDDIEIRTKQGKIITDLVELMPFFKKLPNGVYEGEFLAMGEFDDSNDQCAVTRSILSTKGDKKGLYFVLFDYMKYDEFMNQNCDKVYSARRNELMHIVETLLFNNYSSKSFIKLSSCIYRGKDLSIIDSRLKKVEKEGKEGLVGKLLNGKYEFKKSENQVKIKSFKDVDLKIIDFLEGDNSLKGTLGCLVVDYKGYRVGVGSGLTEGLRNDIWNNKDKYLGKIAEVKFKDETRNQDGGISLQFPVLVGIREDGKEISYD